MRVYHAQKLERNSQALTGSSQVNRPLATGVTVSMAGDAGQNEPGRDEDHVWSHSLGSRGNAKQGNPGRTSFPQQFCRRLVPLQCQSGATNTHSGAWLALGTAQLMTQSCCHD